MTNSLSHKKPDKIKSQLGKIRENWNLLSAVAVLIITAIGKFLRPPPADTNIRSFLVFIVPLWVVMMLYFIFRWNKKKDAQMWLIVTLLSVIVICPCVIYYFHIERSWTAQYAGRKVITGSVYTERGEKYRKEHPDKSIKDIITDAAGKIEQIWTEDSINQRRTWMGIHYLFCGLLITTAMMAGTQIIYCMRESRHGH